MRLAALVSGGKDSMLALHIAAKEHEIACLVGVIPENPESYMFHTPNLHLLDAIASCLNLPIFKVPTPGREEEEVEDLAKALQILRVDGIVIGGIESEYQRSRFAKVCEKIGIEMIAPLWHQDPRKIMEKVVKDFEVIFVRTAAMGMGEEWLGRKIDEQVLKELKELNRKYGIHLAGEGGEFETLVLDAPLYRKKIVIKSYDIIRDANSSTMIVKDYALEEKS
ncbi:diphthine--ammonia ligase [Archaeoglobus veneficus]|uniref:Universal metal-binding-domain/4Fe-4S-binding-domain containing ABC transporter protein n=1 Tax=Archaeoglobus veneficus (strain DSM 11195 / SNP6) TaxID=693661 RepID=F2KSQ2_ARCVS|nr:TIGR00289 family protein [Archaeoglobus veneficus]AEA46947.1 universal metal-binding-domain/4Fe-4S-binding-domain containing ABC transporter protein [Archaeoglobus veneficus SNP6]